MNAPARIVLPLIGMTLLGCARFDRRDDAREPGRVPSVAAESPAVAAPRDDADDNTHGVFSHVVARYDRDDDGAITREEYDRPGGDFDRLDRTMDGILTAEDFAASGRRVRGLATSEAERLRGVHLVAWYLQDDSDRTTVGRVEVRQALRAYDHDGNGTVGRSEFESISERRARLGRRPAGRWSGLLEPETTDPWERLVAAVDGDDDGFVTAAELDAFYARNESEWTFAPAETLAPSPSLIGRKAPDFTLPTTNGDERITLSDFAGDRPVALIFGSYT